MWSELLNVIVASLCGYIVWLLKRKTEALSDEKKCLVILMRNLLKTMHDEYTERGWISSEEYAEYMDTYGVYAHMGGNGLGKRYAEDIRKIEVR